MLGNLLLVHFLAENLENQQKYRLLYCLAAAAAIVCSVNWTQFNYHCVSLCTARVYRFSPFLLYLFVCCHPFAFHVLVGCFILSCPFN